MSQCSWSAEAQQDIIAITSPPEAVSVSRTTSAKHGGLSSAQVAGIVIAGLTGSLILLAVMLKVKWRLKSQASIETKALELEASEESGMKIPEIDGRDQREHELDGYEYPGPEIDGQELPGHELEGVEPSCELSGGEHLKHELGRVEPSCELSGGEHLTHELPALEFPGGEMPVPETRSAFKSHEMP